MKRGEIWWANLPSPVGSEPGYRRPVLIVQINELTQSPIQTVLVAVISSNLGLARAKGNVFIAALDSGLPKDSVINVTQISTADKQFLDSRVRQIDPQIMTEVERGILTVMGLEHWLGR